MQAHLLQQKVDCGCLEKGGQEETFPVMGMFTISVVVVVSQVYTYRIVHFRYM